MSGILDRLVAARADLESASPCYRSRRSAFFERFTRAVGLAPMEYLLAWRMAIAKDLLGRRDLTLADVAERVGYGSASAFSTAFSRYVGQPPSRYARGAELSGRT
jgi:AraC-like DNA-binding protein